MDDEQDDRATQSGSVAQEFCSDGKPFFAYVIPSGSPLSEGSWGKTIDLFPFQEQMLRSYGILPSEILLNNHPNKHTGE